MGIRNPMRLRVTLIPVLLLWAASALPQEAPAPKRAEPRLFEFPVAVAQGRRLIAFEFPAGGFQYHVTRTGLGKRSRDAAPAESFNLHLSRGDLIRTLYYAEYQGDALLLLEVSNGAYGAGFLVRIGGAHPDIKWKQALPGFNVGRGLIEGDFAYVTAMRFVAKVDLRSGSYAWQHEDQEHQGAYEAFDAPRLEGSSVLFPTHRAAGAHADAVTVEKQSGRVLSPRSFARSESKSQ
jgi:hypothetical protein